MEVDLRIAKLRDEAPRQRFVDALSQGKLRTQPQPTNNDASHLNIIDGVIEITIRCPQ
jgi:hypothetical protein